MMKITIMIMLMLMTLMMMVGMMRIITVIVNGKSRRKTSLRNMKITSIGWKKTLLSPFILMLSATPDRLYLKLRFH